MDTRLLLLLTGSHTTREKPSALCDMPLGITKGRIQLGLA